jgi:hypothetical protein
LNSRSSTIAELIGVSDNIGPVLWLRNFMVAQGFDIKKNVIYQDNMSSILLEKNGKHSSGKNTRHVDIRYFFITDCIQKGLVSVEYCPTEEMIADFFTKPLQGSQFYKLRAFIMGLDYPAPTGRQECVGQAVAVVDHARLNSSARTGVQAPMIRMELLKAKPKYDGSSPPVTDAQNSSTKPKNLKTKIPSQSERILKKSYAEIVRSGKKRE